MTSMVAVPVLDRLSAVVDEVAGLELDRLGADELLELVRGVETVKRRVEALDAKLIPQVQQRNVPARHMLRSVAVLLSELLNLSPREARRRVSDAEVLGPRRAVTGEALPPLLPATAAARAAGAITAEHVTVIEHTIDALPARLPVGEVERAEALLVEQAHLFHARTLTGIARQLRDTLDPDGTLTDTEDQHRRRSVSLTPRVDGMWRLAGDLDGEAAALAQTVLHSLAAPKPDPQTGERDPRTGSQRLHDALASVLKRALRAGELPKSGGVPATVLITMTVEQTATARSCTSAASSAWPPRPKPWPSSPAMAAARSPAATNPPNGARNTTSHPGLRADPPTWTT